MNGHGWYTIHPWCGRCGARNDDLDIDYCVGCGGCGECGCCPCGRPECEWCHPDEDETNEPATGSARSGDAV